jgi:hypothetical protein
VSALLDAIAARYVCRWPCTGPGPHVNRYDDDIGGWWRAMPRPALSGWQSGAGDYLRRYWLHPRPADRQDCEVPRAVAASICVDTLRYSLRLLPALDYHGRFGPVYFGEARTPEQAQREIDQMLRDRGWLTGGEE